jgi:hypothetical protein
VSSKVSTRAKATKKPQICQKVDATPHGWISPDVSISLHHHDAFSLFASRTNIEHKIKIASPYGSVALISPSPEGEGLIGSTQRTRMVTQPPIAIVYHAQSPGPRKAKSRVKYGRRGWVWPMTMRFWSFVELGRFIKADVHNDLRGRKRQ